jgi:predicted dehydrogenase
MNRRRFLKAAGTAIAAPYVITSSALGADGRAAAGSRITMAAIGVGGRGSGDMKNLMNFGEVQMLATCDPVPDHCNNAKATVDAHYGSTDCRAYSDFRDVLARDDIDAVLIGTPDHWHAIITIEACKHGKDVFCEKPECLTIREGRAMADAVRRHGRVFSGGSQRVLGDYGDWPRLVRGGALGEITEVFVSCGGPSGDCYLPAEPIPTGLDWDMWLGPAPWRPYHEGLVHGKFRPYRDYSGGGMTDWGAHRFGAALFALGLHKTGPVEVIPPDGEEIPLLTYRFANGLRMYRGGDFNNDICYVGTEGELRKGRGAETAPSRYLPLVDRVDMEGYRGQGGIFGDFVHCVQTREVPFRDIESAHRATTVCHLGNIAYWLNRPLKWDPEKEEIVGDPEASRWLDRPKRAPWVL